MQYAQPTSTSLPQAGHFNSPSGGWPQCGQKLILRAPGNEPPQYGHRLGGALSGDSASSKAGTARGAGGGTGTTGASEPETGGGMGFSEVQLTGSSSSSSSGSAGGAYAVSPRRNRSAAMRFTMTRASGKLRNTPGSGFTAVISRCSAARTSSGSSRT